MFLQWLKVHKTDPGSGEDLSRPSSEMADANGENLKMNLRERERKYEEGL